MSNMPGCYQNCESNVKQLLQVINQKNFVRMMLLSATKIINQNKL
jgi:hypothetical protein